MPNIRDYLKGDKPSSFPDDLKGYFYKRLFELFEVALGGKKDENSLKTAKVTLCHDDSSKVYESSQFVATLPYSTPEDHERFFVKWKDVNAMAKFAEEYGLRATDCETTIKGPRVRKVPAIKFSII